MLNSFSSQDQPGFPWLTARQHTGPSTLRVRKSIIVLASPATLIYNHAMVRSRFSVRCLIALPFLCSAALAFQASSVSASIAPRFKLDPSAGAAAIPQTRLRVDSSLVLIPVHVTTPAGTSVTTLTKEHFQLFEDGVEQKITQFAKDDAPISIGFLFDTSGSMTTKIRKSSEAAATFFKTANADDEFFLVEFNDRPKLTIPFTPDSDLIYRKIARTRPFGRTSLLDAIHLAMVQMKSARNLRKAIVVVSDGGDNRSRFTSSDIKSAMLESDVQLYAMGIFDLDDLRKHPVEEINGPQLLDDLAEQTGGRSYTVEDLNDLDSISARISNELRNQYLLGYSPSDGSRDGKFRRVRLKLNAPADMPDLRTYYRHGYHAPAQ
jgi:Ca-activated chloride channel family protein